MKNNLVFNNQNPPNAETLKARALRELEGALLSEEYERCAALIGAAKGVGASQEDVARLLKEAVKLLDELAPKKPKGRLRF